MNLAKDFKADRRLSHMIEDTELELRKASLAIWSRKGPNIKSVCDFAHLRDDSLVSSLGEGLHRHVGWRRIQRLQTIKSYKINDNVTMSSDN